MPRRKVVVGVFVHYVDEDRLHCSGQPLAGLPGVPDRLDITGWMSWPDGAEPCPECGTVPRPVADPDACPRCGELCSPNADHCIHCGQAKVELDLPLVV